mmetsp:Transcript_65696/g.99046  ORF Transcript_65696/g.99046 Transcript_65696/m.99046 type:complete len:92 (-) Transcript_65696:545-820(-)
MNRLYFMTLSPFLFSVPLLLANFAIALSWAKRIGSIVGVMRIFISSTVRLLRLCSTTTPTVRISYTKRPPPLNNDNHHHEDNTIRYELLHE